MDERDGLTPWNVAAWPAGGSGAAAGGSGASFQPAGDAERAIEIDDSNPKAFLSRAQLLESLNRPADALQDYERVVALVPQHEVALRKVINLTPS